MSTVDNLHSGSIQSRRVVGRKRKHATYNLDIAVLQKVEDWSKRFSCSRSWLVELVLRRYLDSTGNGIIGIVGGQRISEELGVEDE